MKKVKILSKNKLSSKGRKVLVAMSGGVDSSVAALLLKQKGFNIMGIFMHFWKDGEAGENKCCSDTSLSDARRICQILKIPFYTLNFSKNFKEKVVDYFISEYETGKTPNPCVVCNKHIKIGGLIKKAKELGFDYIATGHYASIRGRGNKLKLYKAQDNDKDQSYFLYRLSQAELNHLYLPLENLKKSEVRKIAEKYKLPTAKKRESQEVCFIPEKSHNDFLKRNLKLKPGKIKTLKGEILGKHQGLPLYTIGQRRGVELGGRGPYYVIKADYKTNTLYVTNNGNDSALFKDSFFVKKVNWVSGEAPKLPFNCEAVIRYRHKPVKCNLEKYRDKIKVKLASPQRAVTPGQSAVFYVGKELIGGGIIS